MVYTPTTPPSTQSLVPQTVQLTEFYLVAIQVGLPIGNLPEVTLTWQEGYKDSNGTFIQVATKTAQISTPTVLAQMQTQVTSSNTRYDEDKNAYYQMLVDDGHIPAGTVQ